MEDLFDLVAIMNGSEKRYFKLHARRHGKEGQDTYMELFDQLASMDQLDRAMLKDWIARHFPKGQPNFHIHYLKSLVLRSMEGYAGGKGVAAQIRSLVAQLEWLHEKKMYQLAYKKNVQALEMAEKYGLEYEFPVLLRWKRRLFLRLGKPPEELADLEEVEARHGAHLAAEQQLQAIHDRLLLQTRRERRMADAHLRPIIRQAKGQLTRLERKGLPTFQSKALWYTVQALLALMAREKERVHHWHGLLLEHWYRHPIQIQEQEARFLATLIAYLNSGAIAGNSEGMLKTLEALRQHSKLSQDLRQAIAWHRANVELLQRLNGKELQAALLTAQHCERLFSLHHPPADLAANLYFNAATATFLTGQFREALPWLARCQAETGSRHRPELHLSSVLMAAAACFQIGDLDGAEARMRQGKRILRNLDGERPFEEAFLDVLAEGMQGDFEGGERKRFQEFCSQFSVDKMDSPPPPGQRQLHAWAFAMGSGDSIGEVFLR